MAEPKKMTFEQAKAAFLKKLGGKDLADYGNDLDRKEDAKLKDLQSDPEYMKIWEDAEKQK